MIDYQPFVFDYDRSFLRLVMERIRMHAELRDRIRRSAGLPAGNLVTGAFRRRTKRSPRP